MNNVRSRSWRWAPSAAHPSTTSLRRRSTVSLALGLRHKPRPQLSVSGQWTIVAPGKLTNRAARYPMVSGASGSSVGRTSRAKRRRRRTSSTIIRRSRLERLRINHIGIAEVAEFRASGSKIHAGRHHGRVRDGAVGDAVRARSQVDGRLASFSSETAKRVVSRSLRRRRRTWSTPPRHPT
jgi:hypothetical protein